MYANAKIVSRRNMFPSLKRPRVSRNNTLILHSSCKLTWQPHRSTSSRFFRSRDLGVSQLALFDMAENNGANVIIGYYPIWNLTIAVGKLNSPWHMPILVRMQIPRKDRTIVGFYFRFRWTNSLAIGTICDVRRSKLSMYRTCTILVYLNICVSLPMNQKLRQSIPTSN